MGDRTHCEIKIHKHYYTTNKKTIDEFSNDEIREEEDDTVSIVDYEANYGQMEPLENFLSENKIEYDKGWEAGSEYGPGSQYARNVDGEYRVHDIYDVDEALLTELKTILAETDPTKREALLNKRIKELEPFEVTPLKAPNSIDFIKNA